MSGLHPRAMKPRDESAHPVVQHALDTGYLDTGADYPVDGLRSHDIANQARLSVNRAGKHLGVSVSARVVDSAGNHCLPPCPAPESPHGVRFRVHSKNRARAYVLAETGGDPSKLRYNPFQKKRGPVVDENGRRL